MMAQCAVCGRELSECPVVYCSDQSDGQNRVGVALCSRECKEIWLARSACQGAARSETSDAAKAAHKGQMNGAFHGARR